MDTGSPSGEGTSRRSFLRVGLSALGLAGLAPVLSACDVPLLGGGSETPEMPVEGPEEALQRLIEGNQRFASGASKPINESADRRAKIVQRQRPFAMIFSCVDSRVPPELIFDRGLGDLFVVRTAGQVTDHAVMGSLEYGAYELEVPLLMVLGHKKCGAVKATMEAVEAHAKVDGDIGYLVKSLAPIVEGGEAAHGADGHGTEAADGHSTDAAAADGHSTGAAADGHSTGSSDGHSTDAAAADGHSSTDAAAEGDPLVSHSDTATTVAEGGTTEISVANAEEAEQLAEELTAEENADGEATPTAAPDELTKAITRNVAAVVERVSKSPLIAERIKKDRLLVVGGVYDLETGLVELTANVPDQFKPQTATAAEGETESTG